MKILLFVFMIVNIFTVAAFGMNYMFEFNWNVAPKFKAKCSVLSAILLLCYLFLIILISVAGAFNQSYSVLILLPFALFPFVIGRYVQYNTLKKYSFIQGLCFLLSFVFASVLFSIG